MHGPRTQAYGETNYLDEKTRFWIEPGHYMVLGLKPMGKPTTWLRKLGFGQNQGITWSSDSSLWGNQLLGSENWVFDRSKALHGPQTQAYGETNYSDEKTRFWTETRHCMVLGLKSMGKPTTWMRKLGFGQNQGIAWSSNSSLWGNQLLG